MNDVIEKLVADLRLRLGRKQGPKPGETVRWGALNIPFIAPLLLSLAFFMGTIAVFPHLFQVIGPLSLFLCPFGFISFTVALFTIRSRMNRAFLIRAYIKLLNGNERFTLYEYCRYLKRRIDEAEQDPSLGGPTEVERLRDLSRRLTQHLREGSAESGREIASTLSEEALVAESVLEAYDLARVDPLRELDNRLPEELRAEIERLDREDSLERRGRESE